MATHSTVLAWKIPWMEEPGRLQSLGSMESDTTERLHFHFSLSYIGEGNGNPLQCSCLENPRNGGAWWAAIYGVAQSRTWLKRLSSSSSNSFSERGGGGQPPLKSEVYGRAQSSKVGRLYFGGRCSRISRGTPEAQSCLCVCQASFLMTFAMSGVPHAGSRQSSRSCIGFYFAFRSTHHF